MRHYLDYNASAPMNENVKDYIKEIIDFYGNPSSIHTKGRKIKNILELSRKRIASLINCQPNNMKYLQKKTTKTMLYTKISFLTKI